MQCGSYTGLELLCKSTNHLELQARAGLTPASICQPSRRLHEQLLDGPGAVMKMVILAHENVLSYITWHPEYQAQDIRQCD